MYRKTNTMFEYVNLYFVDEADLLVDCDQTRRIRQRAQNIGDVIITDIFREGFDATSCKGIKSRYESKCILNPESGLYQTFQRKLPCGCNICQSNPVFGQPCSNVNVVGEWEQIVQEKIPLPPRVSLHQRELAIRMFLQAGGQLGNNEQVIVAIKNGTTPTFGLLTAMPFDLSAKKSYKHTVGDTTTTTKFKAGEVIVELIILECVSEELRHYVRPLGSTATGMDLTRLILPSNYQDPGVNRGNYLIRTQMAMMRIGARLTTQGYVFDEDILYTLVTAIQAQI